MILIFDDYFLLTKALTSNRFKGILILQIDSRVNNTSVDKQYLPFPQEEMCLATTLISQLSG